MHNNKSLFPIVQAFVTKIIVTKCCEEILEIKNKIEERYDSESCFESAGFSLVSKALLRR